MEQTLDSMWRLCTTYQRIQLSLPSKELRLKAIQLKFIRIASWILAKMLKADIKKLQVLYLWKEIWEFITY